MTLLPPTAAPFVIHTRTYYQTNSERNKLPPTFSQKIPKMHLCHGIVLSVASQTINHLRSGARACTNFYAHIHTPHTLLEPDSLIHCCHGNPIKGGHSGCNSGEISLLYLSISLSFTHTHTHTHTFLFFHCQPFLFVSLHYFLFLAHCPSPSLLASPLLHLSARLSPLLCYVFIFSPPASHFSGECKYVISLLKPSSCLYL